MKKTIALALICSLAVTMVACFGGSDSETMPDTSMEPSTTDGTHESSERETSNHRETDSQKPNNNSADASPAQMIVDRFRNLTKENTDHDAKNLVENLIKDGSLTFSHTASTVEEGLLEGFNDSEVRGFKEGVMFTPDFSNYASIGYVFTLDDETQAKDFAKQLEENADRNFLGGNSNREVVTEVSGNKVLFIMAPASYR